jgi:DegV family protein with EDD domain
MRKINFITDCTSDLTPEIINKYQIKVLPLYVSFGEESYRDGIDITTVEMYKKVEEYKALPKSAALPPAVFHQEFSLYSKDEDVIFMGIGSLFSGTYGNACLAALDFDNVYVVDSQNLSSGIGLLILKMCKFREMGMGTLQIIEEIHKLVPLVRTQFAINTLEYLHMGGRCSGTARLFGTLLKIKPIIRVIDGAMYVAKKPLGKFTKALDSLLDYVNNDIDNLDEDNIMVTHSLADEDVKYLIAGLQDKLKLKNIIVTKASGVISTHCGPRTIGILYILKK